MVAFLRLLLTPPKRFVYNPEYQETIAAIRRTVEELERLARERAARTPEVTP